MTKTIYNGIAKDKRTKKEKSKDFNAKELLVSGNWETFRKVNSLSEVIKGAIRNQNGSGSCVTHALAKAIELSMAKQNFESSEIERVVSSIFAYQNRSNKPEGGSSPVEMAKFTSKNGFYLERDVPSMNLNDSQMDSYEIANFILKKQGYEITYFIDSTPEFDEIATYVAQYGSCMLLIDCDADGYIKDIPTPNRRNHQIRHEVACADSINLDNTDYIAYDDSWGIFGPTELAKRGQRLLTKQAFYGMVEQALVIIVSKVEDKAKVDYNKYSSLPKLEFGDRSNDVLRLQNMLKDAGYMPENLDTINYDSKGNSYGYYGKSTAYYVLKWQLDNIKTSSQAQLKAWGGKYFGNASILAIKNNNAGSPADNNMEYKDLATLNKEPIKFKISKYLQIVGSIVVAFLLTVDLNTIVWNKAGLIALASGFIQFGWQALQKKLSQDKG